MSIFEREQQLGTFDAVLAATASGRQATALVSADTAFADLLEIAHVIPDHRGIAQLLQG